MTWFGACNRCGACCRIVRGSRVYVCANLIQTEPITACAVWDARTPLMPIRMVAEDGREIAERCIPDFPVGSETVPAECSYFRAD